MLELWVRTDLWIGYLVVDADTSHRREKTVTVGKILWQQLWLGRLLLWDQQLLFASLPLVKAASFPLLCHAKNRGSEAHCSCTTHAVAGDGTQVTCRGKGTAQTAVGPQGCFSHFQCGPFKKCARRRISVPRPADLWATIQCTHRYPGGHGSGRYLPWKAIAHQAQLVALPSP